MEDDEVKTDALMHANARLASIMLCNAELTRIVQAMAVEVPHARFKGTSTALVWREEFERAQEFVETIPSMTAVLDDEEFTMQDAKDLVRWIHEDKVRKTKESEDQA